MHNRRYLVCVTPPTFLTNPVLSLSVDVHVVLALSCIYLLLLLLFFFFFFCYFFFTFELSSYCPSIRYALHTVRNG